MRFTFIRDSRAKMVPMVGICFGHQIIAQALGGRVEKFDGGWAVGRKEYDTSDGTMALNAWHQDQVLEPPEGAITTASSDFCAHAALVYPDGIWTVQPHPEFNSELFEAYIATSPSLRAEPRRLLIRNEVEALAPGALNDKFVFISAWVTEAPGASRPTTL